MLKHFVESNVNDMVFIRNSFRRYIYIAIFLIFVNYSLTAYLYYNLLTVKDAPNFATTTDGRIVNIYPE